MPAWAVWASGLALLSLAAFCLFFRLGEEPIHHWDESRNAINAIEMARSGRWLVTTYLGDPDLWNTKPPLLIGLQALCVRLLGPTEWAVRLPSAVASLLAVLAVWRFAYRTLNRPLPGVLAGLILLVNPYFLRSHAGRFGDYEALLCLLTLLALLAFFKAMEERPRQFLWFWLFLALACLTKGIAGLLAAPALGLYVLYRQRLGFVLRSAAFWAGAAVFLLLVGGFYGLREQAAPGYLQAVFRNELGGRFLETNEEHAAPFYYYAQVLVFGVSPGFVLLAGMGVLLALLRLKQGSAAQADSTESFTQTRFLVYCMLISGVLMLVLSASQTKLPWYLLPAMPFLSFLAAEGTAWLMAQIRKRLPEGWVYGFLALAFAWPICRTMYSLNHPDDTPSRNEAVSRAVCRRLRHMHEPGYRNHFQPQPGQPLHLVPNVQYEPAYQFYIQALAWRGVKVRITDPTMLKPGDALLYMPGSRVGQEVQAQLETVVLQKMDSVRLDSVVRRR